MATTTGSSPELDPEHSKELLWRMIRIRAVEETIARRYSEWKMRCPTHLCTGQEAVAAGVGLALRDDDYMVGSHRAHGFYLGKGGDLPAMLAEIYGKVDGCASGKGGSMHLIDQSVGFMGSTAIVANTIPVGVGLAFSSVIKGDDRVSAICFGEGATEEGVFYESANFAALKKLPALFICENNLYSVYSPLSVRQPEGRKIHEMVAAIGLHSEAVDGNDAEAVYTATARAVMVARAGEGPAFLELATYRWREHCGPNFDNHIGYRTEAEYESWKERDPIAALQKKLVDRGVVSNIAVQAQVLKVATEVAAAFDFAENSPFPEKETIYQDLWSGTEEVSE